MNYHNNHGGGREECSSSESGWTMYIGSPDEEYSYVENDHDHGMGKTRDVDVDNAENNESDDSMISDASSGPSHQGFVYRGSEDSRGYVDTNHAEQKSNNRKKQQRQVQKKPNNPEKKPGKEELGSKVNSNSSRFKFRKNK